MSLHEELSRLADSAPRPAVDHDLWDRGRALRRRDHVVTSTLVLVTVLLVGGLTSLVLGPPRAVAPAEETVPEGAIPSHIRYVPTDSGLVPQTRFDVGQGSAAFVSGGGLPVVISATDGSYHVLDLPDWEDDSVLALSPSGDQLAWLSQPDPDGTPGLRVLTLEDGEIVTHAISQDAGFSPGAVSWSPSGQWLAWLGDAPSGSFFGTVTGAGTPSNVVVESGRTGLVGVAVADDGSVTVGTRQGGLLLDAMEDDPTRISRSDGLPASYSPDGSVLALETRVPSTGTSSVEVATRKQWRHPFPADTLDLATTRPVGWIDDRLQLILLEESPDEAAEFIMTTPQLDLESTWRRNIGSVEPGVATSLTVATDLVPDPDGSPSQPLTHDFGEPEWAEDRDISWMIGLGVAGALSLLYGLRWLWRRRTRLP